MAISNNKNIREFESFRQTSNGGTALAVVNPDGSVISASGSATVAIGSAPTIYAVVNTAAQGQASVVLDTGTKFIGLATVVAGSAFPVTDNSGSITVDWLSGATVSLANQPPLTASSAFIGLATVVPGQAFPVTDNSGSLTVDWISGATVAVSNIPNVTLAAGSSFVGLVSTASINGNVQLQTGTNFVGLATVVLSGSASIAGIAPNGGKTFFSQAIALAATNLSGATAFVSASAKNWYLTNLVLSNASNVGIALLNGATYLAGNASIRMQLPAQGGLSKDAAILGSMLKSQSTQTNLLIATDTASPVAGWVSWYEE